MCENRRKLQWRSYALACEALAKADLREALSSIAAKTLVVCSTTVNLRL